MFLRAHRALFGYEPSRSGRRLIYSVFAILVIIGWYGFVSGYPMLSDRFTPFLWAAAGASCIVGAVKVDYQWPWVVSGVVMVAACAWRTLSLVWFELVGEYPAEQAGPSLIAVAVAGWSMATIGVVAVWGSWLRPDQ